MELPGRRSGGRFKIYGWSGGGHGDGWGQSRRRRGLAKVEEDDLVWQLLKETAGGKGGSGSTNFHLVIGRHCYCSLYSMIYAYVYITFYNCNSSAACDNNVFSFMQKSVTFYEK